MALPEQPVKRTIPTWLLAAYSRRLLKKQFANLQLGGEIEALLSVVRDGETPLIFYANHHSWWDGFWDVQLMRALGLDFGIFMDAAQLERYWFFQHTGCFGVDLSTARGRAQGMRRAHRWLSEPSKLGRNRALVLYPEGRQHPETDGLLPFQSGLDWLLKQCPQAVAVPVWKKAIFLEDMRPNGFMSVGPFQRGVGAPAVAALEEARDALFEQLGTGRAHDWKPLWALSSGS